MINFISSFENWKFSELILFFNSAKLIFESFKSIDNFLKLSLKKSVSTK